MKAARSPIFPRLDRLAAVLAMAAVLLRCIVVPGLMLDLDAAARGELTLVICTSTGAKPIVSTSDERPGPRQQSDGGLCSYAAPGHAGAPAGPVALVGERLQPAFEAPSRDDARPSAVRRAFAARAPPTLS